jgi:hypothetical protein
MRFLLTRVTPSITEKLVPGDLLFGHDKEGKIGETGLEVRVEFI